MPGGKMEKKAVNKLEFLSGNMLEDLGFELIESSKHGDQYDYSFEVGYRHPVLDARNLILVDYKNGCWHFAQRKHAMSGIGKMVWLDDLITGFEFVTNQKLIK
jgi:hypothetical protein